MPLIAARSLAVRLAGRLVLKDVDLSVERGEIVTLVGPNGAGKTTLLRALIGVLPATGHIERAPGLRIAYVPQHLQLQSTLPMTVKRFVRLGTRSRADGAARVLAENGVSDLAEQQMSALSGGQFQCVLLARAMLAEPDLMMLDEPAQGLDPPGVTALHRLIETIPSRLGCGVLMISHDLDIVMLTADRVVGVNGAIRCEGDPATLASTAEYHALFSKPHQNIHPFQPRMARTDQDHSCLIAS